MKYTYTFQLNYIVVEIYNGSHLTQLWRPGKGLREWALEIEGKTKGNDQEGAGSGPEDILTPTLWCLMDDWVPWPVLHC